MPRSDTTNFANALISPFVGSMATLSSRAGPTAFFAADSNDSCTAPTRTSRLMPFSRSQNSKTAKKSAFIFKERKPHEGNKKVGRFRSSDFGALANQQIFTVLTREVRVLPENSQALNSGLSCPNSVAENLSFLHYPAPDMTQPLALVVYE